eukprot:Gb_12346 [translate_table: standard]
MEASVGVITTSLLSVSACFLDFFGLLCPLSPSPSAVPPKSAGHPSGFLAAPGSPPNAAPTLPCCNMSFRANG